MAYIDNTSQHYGHRAGANIREELSGTIAIVEPVETPLLSVLPVIPSLIMDRKPQWLVETLPIDDTVANIPIAHAKQEGADADFEAQRGRTRLHSFCQINSRAVDVTGSARHFDAAGVSDEFPKQLEDHNIGLANEVELAALWGRMDDVDSAGDNQTTDPGGRRATGGIMEWLIGTGSARQLAAADYTFEGTDGAVVPSDFFAVAHSAASDATTQLTRATFNNNILIPAHRIGTHILGAMGFLPAALKFAVTEFTLASSVNINDRNIPAAARMFIDTIDAIQTQFGIIYLNMHRKLDLTGQQLTFTGMDVGGGVPPADDLIVDLDKAFVFFNPNDGMVEMGYARPFHFEPLAKVGDSTKGHMIGEWVVVVRTPKALFGGVNYIP